MTNPDWCLGCGDKLDDDETITCRECVFPPKDTLRMNPMTHDQLREACERALPTYNMRCHCCGGYIHAGTRREMEERLGEHEPDCPLRIVIEAALGNTESEGA